jgi:hypothetical protein
MAAYRTSLIAVCGVLLAAGASAAERAKADIHCQPAGAPLTYDCVLHLTEARSGTPIEGARVTVGADMPSMPMAHNVRPVAAAAAGEPGLYRLRLELAMEGEWALRIALAAPFRDQVVRVVRFGGESGSAPAHGDQHR